MRCAPLSDGGRLAYDVSGPADAPAILLIRPLGGWRGSWDGFATALARELRVIAFDPRGAGDSSAARLATTRAMARDARALLAVLGLPRAHVYGISLGGMVACWLALDAPAAVNRLVLASTPASGRAFRHDALHAVGLLRCFARRPGGVEACLATRTLSVAFRDRERARLRAIRSCAAEKPTARTALAIGLAASLLHDVRARASAIEPETLVLAGIRDALLDPAEQLAFARMLPRARFDAIDAGHDVSAEAPEETAARVLAHVARA